MTDTAGTVIAVLAALGAAGSFGVAAALQHRQAQLAPRAAGPSLRLLARLAGRPLWLGPGTAGLLLSASAFQAGPLATSLPVMDTVEPVSGVLLGTLLFGERLAGSPAGIVVPLAGAAAAIAGIALLSRYPGTTGVRNAANQAGAAAGPQVPAAESGREAGHAWAAR